MTRLLEANAEQKTLHGKSPFVQVGKKKLYEKARVPYRKMLGVEWWNLGFADVFFLSN